MIKTGESINLLIIKIASPVTIAVGLVLPDVTSSFTSPRYGLLINRY